MSDKVCDVVMLRFVDHWLAFKFEFERDNKICLATPSGEHYCDDSNDDQNCSNSKLQLAGDLSWITSAITGHERKSNHFAPARMSAPCASHCYTAFATCQLLMLEPSLYRAALSRSSMFRRKSWIHCRPPRGNLACREHGMERGKYFTNPHEHVTNQSECVANMSRAPTIMSVLAPEAV